MYKLHLHITPLNQWNEFEKFELLTLKYQNLYVCKMLPMVKTKNPITVALPAPEERIAILWIPTPKAAADDVATILFKPFPRVAPIEDENKTKQKRWAPIL